LWNYRPTAAVAVPYIIVNIYNHPRPIIMVVNNLAGLVLFRVGCRDLSMYFSNKLSL
jgi:hypothetical protein